MNRGKDNIDKDLTDQINDLSEDDHKILMAFLAVVAKPNTGAKTARKPAKKSDPET